VLVVVMVEIGVFLQIRQELSKHYMRYLSYCKIIVYTAILSCAIYWGFKGDFIDFWDAFLWIVAFIFIELNIFEWNQETTSDVDLKAHITNRN
jgi:hypothetical protein